MALADDLFPADFVAEPIAHQPLWQGTGPDSMKHHIQEGLDGVPDLHSIAIATIVQDCQLANLPETNFSATVVGKRY